MFPLLGGIGFGLYFTLGLAYFETFISGSFLSYFLAGICLILICGWLAASHFSKKHAKPLLEGLKTGLYGLIISGIAVWVIGGLLTEDGFSLSMLYRVFFNLLLVGILPIVAILISVSPGPKSPKMPQSVAVSDEEKTTWEECSGPFEFVFDAGTGESVLRVGGEALILIEAADNYCKIHFLQSGSRSTRLVRMPMKEAERVLQQAEGFHRCHRSFIVNGNMVEKILGTSQSYRLKMKHFPDEVPVSRSFDIAVLRGTSR